MSSADADDTAGGGVAGALRKLRANPRLPLIVGVALAAMLLAGLVLWSSEPSYGVLFSNVSDQDGGDIIAQLEQMQVPYKFAAGGHTILVPIARIDHTRLALASQGLPKGGNVGYELMDDEPFGISQFAEHVNYKRSLQGELARTIENFDAVSGARVHLAIPQSSVFVRDKKMPSASIALTLYSGRTLSTGQVNAVIHLVSSSVTDLTPDAVTVVDGRGRLLSNARGSSGADDSQLSYTARIEKDYRKRIESILAPVVGRDNIRARVAADVDFSTGERTEERYGPNGDTSKATIRSEQRSVSMNGAGKRSGGVPGALANQPTPDSPSPINAPQSPNADGQNTNGTADSAGDGLQTSGPAGLADMGKGSSTSSSTVNYEVNRTIRHIKSETGRIQRVSAAVVVDYAAVTDDQGKVSAQPLSDQRMDQIRGLVREAIGYSPGRGDTLKVVNAPFSESLAPTSAPTQPWWQNRDVIAFAARLLKYLLVAIVAWFVWRRLVKPLLAYVPAPTASDQPAALTAGAPAEPDPAALERQQRRQAYNALMETTQSAARNDPRLVAAILKNWMTGNG